MHAFEMLILLLYMDQHRDVTVAGARNLVDFHDDRWQDCSTSFGDCAAR